MNIILKSVILSSILVFILSGCSGGFLNEGASKIRASIPSKSETSGFDAIFFKDNALKDNIINKEEYFSISLLSANICGFRESSWSDLTLFDDSNSKLENEINNDCKRVSKRSNNLERITRGEIAIIVNTGEVSSTKSLSSTSADLKTKGRVIYYNDDMRESGQMINALNLPIYGPKKYNGKNVIFELWMLELDNNESKKTKSLLTSLSSLGGKAYPPSAPILGVLNTLGGAFLSGNQDDVEAHYEMRFDVKGPKNSTISRIPLTEGYYAILREENRNKDSKWDRIKVNEKLGELCLSEGDKCVKPYKEQTWFLIKVARETKESAIDIEFGEELGNFLKKLDTQKAEDFDKTKSALKILEGELEKLTCVNKKNKLCKKKEEDKNAKTN
jgi:hypothetical protein